MRATPKQQTIVYTKYSTLSKGIDLATNPRLTGNRSPTSSLALLPVPLFPFFPLPPSLLPLRYHYNNG
jgi:hypothetical protein